MPPTLSTRRSPPRALLLALLALPALIGCGADAPATPPPLCGHAHNDYLHARPLHEALERGFCSIEADVFEVAGELLVAHEPAQLDGARTLEALYLAPLEALVASGQLDVERGVTLLIDFKSDAQPTYDALRGLLARYQSMLTRWSASGDEQRGAITVVLSGEASAAQLAARTPRLAALDGRLWDLDSPHETMRWLSDNWQIYFSWRGDGPMPVVERRRLVELVGKAHAAGRLVRFWNTPETPAAWRELLRAGVDLINTDELSAFERWLAAQ